MFENVQQCKKLHTCMQKHTHTHTHTHTQQLMRTIDEVNANVAVICEIFYALTFIKELGLEESLTVILKHMKLM